MYLLELDEKGCTFLGLCSKYTVHAQVILQLQSSVTVVEAEAHAEIEALHLKGLTNLEHEIFDRQDSCADVVSLLRNTFSGH